MSRQFDAVVIGSGLGGLTAGALYARAGNRVLVLERNHNFGGAATVYRHGALAIEASLHEIDGLDGEDPKMPILRSLGLDRDIQFVDVGDLHEVRSPLLGEPFVLPRGLDAALAATKQRFPHQAKGLDRYFERIRAIRHAVATLSEHRDDRSWSLWKAPALPRRFWPLIRDRHATLSEALQRLFGDDEAVKLALAPNISYYTDGPDTMPFIAFAIPQASYLLGGGHYVRGGSQVLSDRLDPVAGRGFAGAGTRNRCVLVYCSDYKCSHSVMLNADHWGDEVRLSDAEPRFVCKVCGQRGAIIRGVDTDAPVPSRKPASWSSIHW